MENCSVDVFHSFLKLPCWTKHWLIWINQHQLLLSVLVAIAAILQTVSTRKISIRTQHNVSRVIAISDTSKFIQSCEQYVKFLELELVNWKSQTKSSSRKIHISTEIYTMSDAPKLYIEIITKFASLVEGAKNKDKLFIADFISRLQITESRVNSLREHLLDPNFLVSESEFLRRIIEIIVLYDCAVCILKYGRDPTLRIIPSLPNEISNAPIFNSNLLFDDKYNDLLEGYKWPPKYISERQRNDH